MTKRVLITGVAGFVGSHLAEALLSRGWEVIGLDNLSQGSLDNLASALQRPEFSFTQGDVRDERLVSELATRVSVIAHLAAYKIPRYGGRLDTLDINGRGMMSVLEAARRVGCKVVFTSTSDVYGKNPTLPFGEDASDLVMGSPQVRRWAYAVSKMYSEHLCLGYGEAHKVPVAIVRYFGSYGPRQHLDWWGGPQALFIKAAMAGEEIEVHGDGLQTRCFSYVDDTVRGTALAVERDEAIGEIINIGSTEEITIKGLAELTWRLVGRTELPRVRLVPYSQFGGRYEDVRRRVPDVSKAKRLLGFESTVGLEDGTRRTIAWIRSLPTRDVASVGSDPARGLTPSGGMG